MMCSSERPQNSPPQLCTLLNILCTQWISTGSQSLKQFRDILRILITSEQAIVVSFAIQEPLLENIQEMRS